MYEYSLFFLGCSGALTLSTNGSSPTISVKINSHKIKQKKIKRKSIKVRHPETKKLIKFEHAKLIGNCCWKLWDHYRGGQPYDISRADTYQPGWTIRAVELVEICDPK